jgi:predicted nucleic acid-binding protein
MNRVLLDSSYLIALANPHDKYHSPAMKFSQSTGMGYVIADVVFTEVTYSVRKALGKSAELTFIDVYAEARYDLECVSKSDLRHVHTIMSKYTQFDFVDCCILAIAERLNITRICTFDRRDFQTFVPSHTERLELIP